MNTKYLKLCRLLVCSVIVGAFLFFVYSWYYSEIVIDVWHGCDKVKVTNDYCVFNCHFSSEYEVSGRVTITHTVWASIFEEDFFGKNYNTQIELPRRNYPYWMRVGVFIYGDKYGMTEDWLRC